jgi:hypothetical protein
MVIVFLLLATMTAAQEYRVPALLSSVAYCSSDEILEWSCRPCKELESMQPIDFYEFGDIQMFMAEDERANWVVFRGSDSLEDWLYNIDIGLEDGTWPCRFRIHGGFLAIWDEIFESIGKVVAGLNDSKPVVFAGHSLGGVMATLTAVNTTRWATIYTFGMPRIGDEAFSRCFSDSSHRRYVNERDIFAHLPPKAFGYRHGSQELWWTGTELIECSMWNGEDPECSDSWPGGTSIEEHRFFADVEFKCVGSRA